MKIKRSRSREKSPSFYELNSKEKILVVIKEFGLVSMISFLFYNSFWAILPGFVWMLYQYPRDVQKQKIKKKELLTDHFKEALLSILAALKTGYSIENAFKEAYEDLRYRFGDSDQMVQELLIIIRQLKNNLPIENLVTSFARKTEEENIVDFADIFRIARKSGGDLGRILERTIGLITKRMELRQDIRMIVAAKRYEQNIMNVVPMGIVLYIRISNPGFFDALYGNFSGGVIMTGALALYYMAFRLAEKILEIA